MTDFEKHIVLVEPKIPQNSGNIARLSAATGSYLHFVGELGFELSDKYLKRAGLDYWPYVKFTIHESWDDFSRKLRPENQELHLLTTHAENSHFEVEYSGRRAFLLFGSETTGLPEELHQAYPERRFTIPMFNENVRSLNLSNAAAIVLYDCINKTVRIN